MLLSSLLYASAMFIVQNEFPSEEAFSLSLYRSLSLVLESHFSSRLFYLLCMC